MTIIAQFATTAIFLQNGKSLPPKASFNRKKQSAHKVVSGASTASRKTVWTPAKKSQCTALSDKPSLRKGTVWSTSGRKDKATSSRASTRRLADFHNVGEAGEESHGTSGPRAQYLSRGSSYVAESGKAVWACTFCPYRVEHASGDHICKMRYKHLKFAHNGEGLPGNLSRPKNVVVPSVKNPFWKCPLCPAGITRDMRQKISEGVYYDARWRHCQESRPKIAKDRWKALCVSKVVASAASRQRRRVANLNMAAARVASADPVQDMVRFTWPVVVKKPNRKKALCLHQAWKCNKCGRCFPQIGKARSHDCLPDFVTGKKVVKSRLALLRKHRQLCDKIRHGVDKKTLDNAFQGAEYYLCGSPQ